MNKIIKCNDLNITIYIEDTDFQGFVYHANYLKFFERARSAFLSSNKISQKIINSSNKNFVDGTIEICLINLITKKPQKFPDDLLLIFE